MTDEANIKFLSIIAHELGDASKPGFTGFCAGYERKQWRSEEFATYLMDGILTFCLNSSECKGISPKNAIALARKAANSIYTSKKFENRGEFGELMLHVLLEDHFHTIPAISKLYYKDTRNGTVHGFDAVHVIQADNGELQLWLGEVKFYTNLNRAINDVVAEIHDHLRPEFLKAEFIAITNKVDPSWEHAGKLKKLLDEKTSLDDVFDVMCVPVLLTYDSKVLAKHKRVSKEYLAEIAAEIENNYSKFISKALPQDVRIHLFLVPMHTKKILLSKLDAKLRSWQKV